MKLKDQVLSINQVQELQELGFDVEKYASITKFSCENCKYYGDCVEEIGSDIYMTKNYICDSMNGYTTLTIGDIMEILPNHIFKGNFYTLTIIPYSHSVFYVYANDIMFQSCEDNLIDQLFETLKWCIKEKHIVL